MLVAISALTLLVGQQEGHPACKKWGTVEVGLSGWSGAQPDGWLIFPCTIKSRSSLLAPAHPGGPGKRAGKWLWWWWWILVTIKQILVLAKLFVQSAMIFRLHRSTTYVDAACCY